MTFDGILKMDNPIQPYAWGSRTAIAALMGRACPTDEPQAEIWMGAHPKAPSTVRFGGRRQPLDRLIDQYPLDMLGAAVTHRFGSTLPYLLKVLAVAQPLSIQAHPDKRQAREGFERETRLGIKLDATERNYKDNQHKPECICAVTPFWGACGFRTPTEMVSLLGPVWPRAYRPLLSSLSRSVDPEGFRIFFEKLMHLETRQRQLMVHDIVVNTKKLKNKSNAYHWVVTLHQKYPDDIGVLSPLLLNLIQLAPGQALFLPARQLHAYLDGLGIELMANSDNVLRGGLTPKHIDVAELLAILDFNPHPPEILDGCIERRMETVYASSAEEFILSTVTISADRPYQPENKIKGPEIILCIEGSAVIKTLHSDDETIIEQGRSVFIPAAAGMYHVSGEAKLFKAAVNL
jgi:mannose-6-phosphate isomerase